MGIFKKIANLLTGGGASGGQDRGIYVYVKLRRSGEIVRLRVDPINDVSADDEGQRFTRKLAMGQRSFDRVEATIYFDNNNRVTNAEMSGAELSTREAYEAQKATNPAKP